MAIQFETEQVVEPKSEKKPVSLQWPALGGGRKAGAAERMFFTEQLALLLETGESSSIASFAENGDGELFVIDMRGTIYRIVDLASLSEKIYLPAIINP